MKICHIGWVRSPHVTRWVKWLAERGHECYLITDEIAEINGVTVYEIPPYVDDPRPRWERFRELAIHDRSLFRINWIRRKVREIVPDILHSHSLWYPAYLGIYCRFQPYVITAFDGDVLWRKENARFFHRLRTAYALRRARLVFADSQELADGCIRLGAKKDHTYVSRAGGVNLDQFNTRKSKSEARQLLALPTNCPIVLSPRSMEDIYNIETIVQTIPLVQREIPDVLFVFVGHSVSRLEALQNLAQQIGVWEFTRFVGHVEHGQIPFYHRSADVFVSVALVDSGPMALFEAMACGDAPVISDLPCVREWITDGWNGFLVQPRSIEQVAARITRLLKDTDKRNAFASRNEEIIRQRGNQAEIMPWMEQAYLSVLGR